MNIRKPSDPLKPVTLGGKSVKKIAPSTEVRHTPAPDQEETTPKENLPYHATSIRRREELTALLWGAVELDLEEENPEPDPSPTPLEKMEPISPTLTILPKTEYVEEKVDTNAPHSPARRALLRRTCSFPGLLRILIPEHSFQPKTMAVRIIDLSPVGAQVETKQLNRDLSETLRKDRRFARLEALLPGRDKMILSGRIAWASYGTELSRLGIEFERAYPEVSEAFVADIAEDADTENLCLGSPLIDPFPSVTSKTKYTFSGFVQDAEEVAVRNGSSESRTAVKAGRFKIEIPLLLERSNFLSFTASRGSVYSIPTPVCIAHQSGASDTMSYSGRKLVEEFTLDPDARHLTLRLGGPAGQFFRVFKKLEEALEHVEEMELAVEISGDAAKVAAILESLKRDS